MYYIKYLDMFRAILCHLQAVKIVFLQHLESSLSVSGRAVHRQCTDSDDTRCCKNTNFDLLKMSMVLLETCRGI
jgi:hypothetical protein